jgi:3-oxoacyl-[acyl-carrier protein] reductase
MNLGLVGRVALVTAASKGLGRAVAEEMAAEGATVAMCARGEAALRDAAGLVASKGNQVLPIIGDVSRPEDVERIVGETISRFGRVDILINNAGGPPSGPFESLTPSQWEEAIRLTLLSAVNLTRLVLPGMKERRWGRIINVTSITVKQPVDGLMLSNSIRAAVTGFARTLANEVATFGITVNNVLPGFTRTERVEELARQTSEREGITVDEALGRSIAQIPMRRLGEPREFGAAVAFLASERASYITGVSLSIDGGWIKGLL